MARGLIALRMSDEELAVLDAIAVVQGDPNRSACLRSLVAQAGRIMGLEQDEDTSPKVLVDGDPKYEDGDYAHDVALEIERLR